MTHHVDYHGSDWVAGLFIGFLLIAAWMAMRKGHPGASVAALVAGAVIATIIMLAYANGYLS